MKQLLFILLILLSAPTYSQKLISGSFKLPAEDKYVVVDWDFSNTVFEKKFSEKEWIAINGQQEWENAREEALSLFLKLMNEELKKSRLIVIRSNSELKSNYTLYICPIELDKKGNNKSYYILKRNNSGEEVGKCLLKGDGGHWGSFANLLGDGYEEAAEKMGKYLRKQNK